MSTKPTSSLNTNCPICLEKLSPGVTSTTNSNHDFHKHCPSDSSNKKTTRLDRKKITSINDTSLNPNPADDSSKKWERDLLAWHIWHAAYGTPYL